jgi:PAS domain S-box-containing protein
MELVIAMPNIFHFKMDRRVLILVFLLFSIALGAAGYYFYENQKLIVKQERFDEIRAISDLKVSSIVNWRKDRLADGDVILETPFIAEHIQQLFAGQKKAEVEKEILRWMQSFQEHYQYHSILLLDDKQTVRLSVPGEEEGPGSYETRTILESMQKKTPILSGLYRNRASSAIRLSLVIPVLISSLHDGPPAGSLLLRIDPDDFLYPLIQSWPTPSPTSESILVRREGNEVLYLNNIRYRKNAAFSLRLSADTAGLLGAMAMRGQEGVVESLDYRGIPVLAAVRRIPDSPWFLFSKVDQKEIYASIHKAGFWTAVVVGVLIMGLGLMGGLFWHKQGEHFEKSMEAQAEEHAKMLDEILSASPDLTYMCDEEGRYVYANYAFLQALKLSQNDIIGKTWQELGFSAETVGKILADREFVFDSGQSVTGETSFPTIGGVRDYEYIKSPIHGPGSSIERIVVSARDITKRKEAEKELKESENRLRSLSAQLLAAQENERKRIAGEIHDSISASLTAILFVVEKIQGQMKQGTVGPESLEFLTMQIQRTIEETRRIMADLRPSVLDDLGVVAATNWFCREFQKTYSCICIERQINVEEGDIPDSLKTPIFRISQEAMNNVSKHTKATLVNLCLHKIGERIELLIQDNGQGFGVEKMISHESSRKGLGLTSMRERAELSGGSFSIESTRGNGAIIRASWPIERSSS